MEDKSFESWESRIKEELADSDEEQLLDLVQDHLIRLAASIGSAKIDVRTGEHLDYILKDELKRRIARVAVLMDVLQLKYDDAADEEVEYLKDIERCLE